MHRTCETCNRNYDDVSSWTICPHGPLGYPLDDYCTRCDTVKSLHGACKHQLLDQQDDANNMTLIDLAASPMSDKYRQPVMETFTGVVVPLLNPTAEHIVIEDIAHHLSLIPRYCGATKHSWTVAQHVMLCMRIFYDLTTTPPLDSQETGLLLHDAPEAYIHDLTSGTKSILKELYHPLEQKFEEAIQERFDYTLTESDIDTIKWIDIIALRAESMVLLKSRGDNWQWPDYIDDDAIANTIFSVTRLIVKEDEEVVEERFLRMLNSLLT